MLFPIAIAGIDGTRAGLEAARQAARLVDDDGRLILLAIEDEIDARIGRWAGMSFAPFDDEDWSLEGSAAELRARIEGALAFAAERIEAPCAVETRRTPGRASETLVQVAEAEGASLLAVGTHGGSRARGIVLGRTATIVAQKSSCSVLLARHPFDAASFPSSVAVGYDESPGAERALDAAIEFVERRPETQVRVITFSRARGGPPLLEARQRAPRSFAFEERRGVVADNGLVEISHAVDLVIVGSRGLRGVRALGSTAESVAHRAASSVLIMRGGT